MRNIGLEADLPKLHEWTERASHAAAVEDDRAFLEAVGKFLESWAHSRR